jgi:predicted transcriptional regulator
LKRGKVEQKNFSLRHNDFIRLSTLLTSSELLVYFWLKTENPIGEEANAVNTEKIAKDLNLSRRTVQRAFLTLKRKKLMLVEEHKFSCRVKPIDLANS